jgi:hypothetical protein
MDTTTKARFIEDFVGDYGKDEQYRDFFIYNDLGVPLALMINGKMVTPLVEGIDIINETYIMLCDILEVDKDKEYTEYSDFIEDSNAEDIELDDDSE